MRHIKAALITAFILLSTIGIMAGFVLMPVGASIVLLGLVTAAIYIEILRRIT